MIESLASLGEPFNFQNISRDLLFLQKLINTSIIKQEEIRMTRHIDNLNINFMTLKRNGEDKSLELSLKKSENTQRYNK